MISSIPERLKPRQMILLPVLLAVVAALLLLWLGIPMSLEFSSGTIISYRGLEELPPPGEIEFSLRRLLGKEVKVEKVRDPATGTFGLDIQTTAIVDENLEPVVRSKLAEFGLENGSIISYSPALSRTHQRQGIQAMSIAAFAIGLCLFAVYRRKIVFISVLCVFLNLLFALAGLAITRTPLSLASFAGLLLLFGYTIDTNVLLIDAVFRGPEEVPQKGVASVLPTGLTISICSLSAMLALNLLVDNPSLDQLSTVLIFGLSADIINTWLLNAGILIWNVSKVRKIKYVSL